MYDNATGFTMEDLIGDFLRQYKEEKEVVCTCVTEGNLEKEVCKEVKNGWLPLDLESEEMEEEEERKRMRRLCSERVQKMEPYVIKVMDEFDFEKSPIYEDEIEEEILEEMIEKIYEEAEKDYPDSIEEIDIIQIRRQSGSDNMAKELLRYMVLSELFYNRRPCKRKQCRRQRYENPYSGYGRGWR